MRTAFVSELERIMKEDQNTFLLTGDIGFSVFDRVKDELSKQYINMGLAEQNMIGVASGMALTGKQIFVYSIIPFIVYRPFEQLRNDVCYQNLPVRLVGVGAGFSYSDQGFTHHAIEDYGLLRSLPNITILSPADPLEVSSQMKQINKKTGPVYIRLGRNGEPTLHNKHDHLKIGKALEINQGEDILFVTSGSILGEAMKISKLLEAEGFGVEILDYHTIKPFDEKTLIDKLSGKKLVATFEEHIISTGLYSLVAEAILNSGYSVKTIPFGITDSVFYFAGTREYMLSQYGMNDEQIYQKIKEAIG